MTPVADPFMADVKPSGLQRGRGGFLRSADDAPYVTDPEGALVKSGERKGQVGRVKYGSPSNRGREIENDASLVKWKQRMSFLGIGMDTSLAEQCRDLVIMDADSEEFRHAADKIAVEADRLTRSWLAADRGTHGHLLCECIDRHLALPPALDGEALGLSFATCVAVAVAWERMLMDNGLEILAIEASCVDDRWRLAGTLDRIVRTTRDLTFVKKSGELVVISAGTVLILDIKFGKCRLAHPIQIASYAQSVPYDTETETRGVWPWPIDQDHALIAHGDFGDDTRPVTIELVWVDLVAGREHGGETVVQAKAWAARDDLFSVAQIVEGGANGLEAEPPLARTAPSPSTQSVNDLLPRAGMPQHALDEIGCDRLNDARRENYEGWLGSKYEHPPTSDRERELRNSSSQDSVFAQVIDRNRPDRLALVDARATLCAAPDEGGDWSTEEFAPLWDELRRLYDTLEPDAKTWRSLLVGQAHRRNVPFHAQTDRTERRYFLNYAVIALAEHGDRTDTLRELLAHIIGDVALFPGVEPGHALGSLSAVEAERFAAHIDAYLAPPPAA